MDFDSLTIKEEKNEEDSKAKTGDHVSYLRDVPKSTRFRRNSIDTYSSKWKFIESEFNFVLTCGILFWVIFLIFWY
jgi:hypothetical protein